MTLATPAMAQQTMSVTLSGDAQVQGQQMEIVGPIKWVPDQNVWLVSLRALQTIEGAVGTLKSLVNSDLDFDRPPYYYKSRFARSYVDGQVACVDENPAAYHSSWETVGGRWERKLYAVPDARHCVTVWIWGEDDVGGVARNNYFHPDGYTDGNTYSFASIWFKTSPNPLQPMNSPGTRTRETTGCFSLLPDTNAVRQCLSANDGTN